MAKSCRGYYFLRAPLCNLLCLILIFEFCWPALGLLGSMLLFLCLKIPLLGQSHLIGWLWLSYKVDLLNFQYTSTWPCFVSFPHLGTLSSFSNSHYLYLAPGPTSAKPGPTSTINRINWAHYFILASSDEGKNWDRLLTKPLRGKKGLNGITVSSSPLALNAKPGSPVRTNEIFGM